MRYASLAFLLCFFLCGCNQNEIAENIKNTVMETDVEEIVLTTAPATAPEIDFEEVTETLEIETESENIKFEKKSRFLPWQIAYRDLVLEQFTGEECFHFKYALVYIDDNKIPALFINTQDEENTKIIYSYYDDNLNTVLDTESAIKPIEEYTLEEILIKITGDYR